MASGDHTYYVPFLKGKQGELDALSHVEREDRENLTPLIEIGPIEINPKTGADAETLDKALEGTAAKIAKAWGSLDFCFVDLPGFEPTARLEDGRHPVARFFDDAKAVDLAALPVTGLDRDAAQLEAIAGTQPALNNRVAIRLRRPELQNPESLEAELRRITAILEIGLPQIDLLLDFGPILKSEAAAIKGEAEGAIKRLPEIDSWRSLTLCAGAFPKSVSTEVKPGETGEIERREWELWKALADGGRLPRQPAFGDYGVASPEWLLGFDSEVISPGAKIFYSRENDWLVVRGRSLKSKKYGKYKQYRALAEQIVNSGSFQGNEHCWGDDYIAKCARGEVGTGSLKSWVTVATSHHLGVVTHELASLS
ncbi:MAG TPA: beta family protein [Solirubrobacterales bacterium]